MSRSLVDALYEHFDAFDSTQEAKVKQLEAIAELWTRMLGKVAQMGSARSTALRRMREAQFWATEAIRLEKEGI
jgi:hypothetical protein